MQVPPYIFSERSIKATFSPFFAKNPAKVFPAGCTELGSQGFAALAESNDQGVGGDSGGGVGCADGIGCADGHGYFLTYSSDKSALC